MLGGSGGVPLGWEKQHKGLVCWAIQFLHDWSPDASRERGQGLHISVGIIPVSFSLNMSRSSLLCDQNRPLSHSSVKIYCWCCSAIFPLDLMNPFFFYQTGGNWMNRNIGVHEQRSCCRHMQSSFVTNSLCRHGILLNCHRIDTESLVSVFWSCPFDFIVTKAWDVRR